ncbi:MAG: FeoB-associated Cys-rich membrane protein [Erysipelotrichaceae bacterium]|nr:FeoB-associated Cys-rich membrane protein [Erysipelotrichaceae bacterium]
MNTATFVVLLLVILLVCFLIKGLIRDEINGCSSCGLDCGACGKCRDLKEKIRTLQQSN